MNDINEMPPKCQYCPYWEVCEYPWVCPDREQLATNLQQTCHATDTISRKAAIDATWFEPSYTDPLNVLTEVRDRLKALPSAQPEQRWIPWDSDRLPEESGTYTVTAYDGVTERVTYAKYQKRLKRWELTGARAYWRVLAWMPLPEPYREERTEE